MTDSFPPVPEWKPGIPAPVDRIVDRLSYYTNGKNDFAVFKNGTCVLLPLGLPEEKAFSTAKAVLLDVFHDHVDMKPLTMDDGNIVVQYKRPIFNIVLSDIASAHWEEIDKNHLKALAPHEVLLSEKGPNEFDDFGKKALFGRCYLFMDAQDPEVVRIVRASA